MQTLSFKPLLEYIESALKNLKKGTPAHSVVLGIHKELTEILNDETK
ncbi:MAG: hypothetical protein RQ763_05125 [Sulfurimonas sp.]|nr:hypothetical protein [Sulfurimonas sp.]MDT8338561.1 hypothetical protein [Sulfurimonas sp.]